MGAMKESISSGSAVSSSSETLSERFSALSLTGKKGKKSLKGKEKKLLKKQQQAAKQQENQAKVERLRVARFQSDGISPRNILLDFAPFSSFNRNDLNLELLFFARNGTIPVPSEILESVYSLTEKNMKELYIAAEWGWNENKKMREFQDDEARLIVAKDKETGELVGFLHFRFLREGDELVLYVYELQVEQEKAGRKGLGRHLMMIAELAARKYQMDWVMLTVLNANVSATRFYEKMGYSIDETSPQMDFLGFDDQMEENPTYSILSKCLKPKA